MEGYDLSDTLPPAGGAETKPRLPKRRRPHAPWPYPNIAPSLFDGLSPEDRVQLEALTLTFIETAHARRTVKPRGRKPG
ncbi:hypothetical protein G6F59_018738 [Rhizopus arrhizus]|nr:hypothetical protein G6F59_018738 [Rhizopus arrhizus]